MKCSFLNSVKCEGKAFKRSLVWKRKFLASHSNSPVFLFLMWAWSNSTWIQNWMLNHFFFFFFFFLLIDFLRKKYYAFGLFNQVTRFLRPSNCHTTTQCGIWETQNNRQSSRRYKNSSPGRIRFLRPCWRTAVCVYTVNNLFYRTIEGLYLFSLFFPVIDETYLL